jgi:uncharacterized membrane protein
MVRFFSVASRDSSAHNAVMSAQPVRSRPTARRGLATFLFGMVAAIAFLYVPLGMNYMLRDFVPGSIHLQETVTSAVTSERYATGEGSVLSIRKTDYADHRVSMLAHTVLGGLALALAVLQFSSRVRARTPAVHRWLGRIYMALMTASMVAAVVFLTLAPSAKFRGGVAFEAQLWGLALGTLHSGWVAFRAIRGGDVKKHRAYMMLSLSTLMTTPLLRLLWTGFEVVFPGRQLLDNLELSTIVLPIVAPAGAMIAFMLTERSRSSGHASSAPIPAYLIAATGLVAGCLLTTHRFQALEGKLSDLALYAHEVPLTLVALIGATGAWAARRQHDFEGEARWRHILFLAPLMTVAFNATWAVAQWFLPADQAYLMGAMVGVAAPSGYVFARVIQGPARSHERTASQASHVQHSIEHASSHHSVAAQG